VDLFFALIFIKMHLLWQPEIEAATGTVGVRELVPLVFVEAIESVLIDRFIQAKGVVVVVVVVVVEVAFSPISP
jgi:hypothetical protein